MPDKEARRVFSGRVQMMRYTAPDSSIASSVPRIDEAYSLTQHGLAVTSHEGRPVLCQSMCGWPDSLTSTTCAVRELARRHVGSNASRTDRMALDQTRTFRFDCLSTSHTSYCMESRQHGATDLPVIRYAQGNQAVDARVKARAWVIESCAH